MPTRTIKLLKEVTETSAIAARIVVLASKEKSTTARALRKLGTSKARHAGAQSPRAKRGPKISKEAGKGR